MSKKVSHAITKIGKQFSKTVNGATSFARDSIKNMGETTKALSRGQFGHAVGGSIRREVGAVENSIAHLTSKSDANVIVPIATVILGAVDPLVGDILNTAVTYAHGAKPLDMVKAAAISYGAGYLGRAVTDATGSQIAGSAARGFTQGTTSGLVEGEGLNKSLRSGLATGLTEGAVTGLNSGSGKSLFTSLAKAGERQLISSELNKGLGLTPKPQSAQTYMPRQFADSSQPANTAPTAGSPDVGGGAVDISGDANEKRSNVWNKSSLKLKDALGA